MDESVEIFQVESGTDEDSFELLRTSPPSQKRRQSPSPDPQDRRLLTPRKQTPSRTKSRGHTPRKDTPVKRKIERFQCRNSGCRDYLANVKSRAKHETQYCRFRQVTTSEVSMETEYSVPSHSDLQLDPLQCRTCLKKYAHERARKKHEQDKHRMFQIQGRTVSPVSFTSPPELAASSRAMSCPPSESSLGFTTPDRPCKRRRTASSSTTQDFPQSLVSSPLASPILTLTPTSISPSPSGFLEESETSASLIQCPFCLVTFAKEKSKYYHDCHFRPDYNFFDKHHITPVVLTRPQNWKQTTRILSQLCKEDVVEMCRLHNWCLPFYYPFCFPHQVRAGSVGSVPLLDTMTASKASSDLLKSMVELHGELKVPKYIILKDEESGRVAFLPSSILAPTTEFTFTELSDFFVVTKKSTTFTETSSDPEESFDKELYNESFEDDDILYCHHGPAPISQSDDDESYGQLPTPPYTRIFHGEDSYSSGGGAADPPDDDISGDDPDDDDIADDVPEDDVPEDDVPEDDDPEDDAPEDDDPEDDDPRDEDTGDENNNMNTAISQELLELLPRDFQPGTDGMGATNRKQMQAASYFRHPWKYSDEEIQNILRLTKKQFFKLVLTCVGAHQRSSSLNIFAECFLMQFKLCHNDSFYKIASLFCLNTHNDASNVFYRQLTHQYLTNCNIPAIIANATTNQAEVDKLLRCSYLRTPLYFKVLVKDFEDPSGRNRTPVILNIDGTYFDIQGSEDIELQKYMYYAPRSGHVAKWINITDLAPKFVGVLPVASSQSPSSGDGLLLAKHIQLQDGEGAGLYIRTLLRGNDEFFVILASDAGFVVAVPNAPLEARGPNVVTLASVCQEEHCVLLHTSHKYERYHLARTAAGKIKKIPWSPGNPSLDENTVKLTRLLRKCQEQIHAALKGMFKILDMRNLWNECLLPFSARQLRWFGLPDEYKDIPKLNIIATVCCSTLNSNHPGFYPLYMDDVQQVRAAKLFMKRFFLQNPLLHPDIWPISFTSRGSGSGWSEITFGDLDTEDVLHFPKLDRDAINPIALEIVSGPHALQRAASLLTYMKQLGLKGQNLTREQTALELHNFPDEWKLHFTEIRAPSEFQPSEDCPSWTPQWWDQDRFGPWHDLKLVKCKIPPSYKSATSAANYHTVVIAFGIEPSDQLCLRPPYDRIYFWYCFKCPSLNGTVSMDRHLSALLEALSFKHLYRSTAKTVNVLNTVADTSRQSTQVLPPTHTSADIPDNIERRGRDRRQHRGGLLDPLYDLDYSSVPVPPPVTAAHPVPAAHPVLALPPVPAAHPVLAPPPVPAAHPVPAPPPVVLPSTNSETGDDDDIVHNNNTANGETLFESSAVPPPPTAQSTSSANQGPAESSRPSARRTAPRRGQSPADILARYLSDLDSSGIFPIPDHSQTPGGDFSVNHLQNPGLLNDGNICSLISVILCFHRLGLKDHLIDPHFCFTLSRTPDFPSWVFMKILSAMPSLQSFSLHLFILSWNSSNKMPRIDPGFADVSSLTEGLVTNLQVKQYANRPPVFTQFLASFKCNACGKNHLKVKNWEEQVQAAIPIFKLPINNQPVNVLELLDAYVQQPIQTRCSNQACRSRIANARFDVDIGFFTVIAVNRFEEGQAAKRSNKLLVSRNHHLQVDPGELVSVVCHRGDVNFGHFVSYHRIGDQWFLNDDSRQCAPSNNPLQDSNVENETVDLLFFKSIE